MLWHNMLYFSREKNNIIFGDSNFKSTESIYVNHESKAKITLLKILLVPLRK